MKPIHLDPKTRQELQRRRRQTHDKRVYERLSAVLWIAKGKSRYEVADLLGRSYRQLSDWLRLFRNKGLDALCTLHYKGDPGRLTPQQVRALKQEIQTGRFHSSDQVRHWLEETCGVAYTPSGIKEERRGATRAHPPSGLALPRWPGHVRQPGVVTRQLPPAETRAEGGLTGRAASCEGRS